ncbi:hypothetical protein MMAD_13430 [Mycolicibacterium madagascariense]|uniref:Uncharacterized protein n=1 Tax=Mycolicibacterium madagascariense TaxID=212765 RepID=A0A7I7XEA2_9MYCO|nr:hypothetical protein [Mycolicibacterium madagascariense]MCV7013599.1 hypothetical protein [Mycolicibacterium madagascariense]BBZ27048.1 hypothetical protein MMAD_13430 [Mycolicibacterium madagascariense]
MEEHREKAARMWRTRLLVASAVTSGALISALGGAPGAGASGDPVSGTGAAADGGERWEITQGEAPGVSVASAHAAPGKLAQTKKALKDANAAKVKVLQRFVDVVAKYDRAFHNLYNLDSGAPTRAQATEELWSLDALVKSAQADLKAADAVLRQAQQEYDAITTPEERAADKAAADKAAADKVKADEAAATRAKDLAAKKAEVDDVDAAAQRAVMNRRALGEQIRTVEAELSALWSSGVDPQSKVYRLKKEEERHLNENLLAHDQASTPIFDKQSRLHKEYDAAVAANKAADEADKAAAAKADAGEDDAESEPAKTDLTELSPTDATVLRARAEERVRIGAEPEADDGAARTAVPGKDSMEPQTSTDEPGAIASPVAPDMNRSPDGVALDGAE